MSTSLQASVEGGKQLANWLAEQVDGLELHGGFRAYLSGRASSSLLTIMPPF